LGGKDTFLSKRSKVYNRQFRFKVMVQQTQPAAQPAQTAAQPAQPAQTAPGAQQPAKKKSLWWLWVIIAVVVVIGLGVGAYFLFF
jgi:hypothetical protein